MRLKWKIITSVFCVLPGTFLRLQEQGKLTDEVLKKLEGAQDDDFSDDDTDDGDADDDNHNSDIEPKEMPDDITYSKVCDSKKENSNLAEISDTRSVNKELSEVKLEDKNDAGQKMLSENNNDVEGYSWWNLSPIPDLEILLEVNLNFQVQLTMILACGIFSPERTAQKVLCRSVIAISHLC